MSLWEKTDANTKMAKILEICDKYFKVAVIKMLQEVRGRHS